MTSRWSLRSFGGGVRLSTVLAVVVIVGAGGVAYACGGGGSSGCGSPKGSDSSSDCQGSLTLIWHTPDSATASAVPVACTLSLTTSTLTVSAASLFPGASCAFTALLENTGSVDAALSQATSLAHTGSCAGFVFSDNVPATPAEDLSASHSFSFSATLGLSSSAASSCEASKVAVSVTITGTGSTSCQYVPIASGLRAPSPTC